MNKIIKASRVIVQRERKVNEIIETDDGRFAFSARDIPAEATAYEYIEGDEFPGNAVSKYDQYQIQDIITLDGMSIVNLSDVLVFWAYRTSPDEIVPFYVTTHDCALYVSTKKKLIKEAIHNSCGCVVE